jgi:hypothetical protein
MNLPSIADRIARAAFFVVVFGSVFLNLSCGNSSLNKNITVHPDPGTVVAEKIPAVIKLLSSNVLIQPIGGSQQPLNSGARELQNGDTIFADETGEAEIHFDTCNAIYIYRESRLRKETCPKLRKQSGNYYCTETGTGAFKDCLHKIITQSDSATVALKGTWGSHSYLPDMELAVVLLFEGSAEARPVTEKREYTLGEATTIPKEHFWFTVPDNRLNEIRALNIGLEPRTPYPFTRLPQLLAKLRNLNLVPVAEQAIRDGAIPSGLIDVFKPPVEPVAGNGNDDGHRQGGNGNGTKGLQAATAYGFTKVGRQSTKEFLTLDHAALHRNSVRITAGTDSFRVIPTSIRSDRFSVDFAPTTLGDHAGVLKFNDSRGRPYTYRLSGTGATSGMQVSSDFLSFKGKDPQFDYLSVISTGDVDLEVKDISLVDDPNGRFKIQSSTCKAPLKRNEECKVTVEHTRVTSDISQATNDSATLSIAHDARQEPMLVRMTAPVLPSLDVVETLPFGPVVIPASCSQVLTVKNNSDKTIQLGKAALDTVKNEFRIEQDTCSNAKLAPQGKTGCSVKVLFDPLLATQENAELIIPYTGSSGTLSRTVKLSGKGEPALFDFPDQSSFGPVQIGSDEKIEKIPIKPRRQPVTKIKRVEIDGTAKGDYRILDETCTKANSGESCEVRIAFKPKAEGLRNAELVLIAADQSEVSRYPIKSDDASVVHVLPVSLKPDRRAGDADKQECGREFRVVIEGTAYAPWKIREKTPICFGGKSVVRGNDPNPKFMQLHLESESQDRLSPTYKITGDAREDFEVMVKKCPDSPKSCWLNIFFAPKATNKRHAILSIAPDVNTPPIEVELYGRGKSSNPFKRFGRWVVGLFRDEAAKSCRR